ncbi:fatty acid desaturase [Micromonospora sp. R77]|uniref:fatty acid desaturase family protein n=1 Tax=Micromonospora sp. R77 TaxID=2925836 RepID=UPI001F60DB29|nr:fatty acid desaturase [Micromonospora sp. R77]MCI4066854.1 fatty acid desaturase [Micromonospora sp. R77]
MKTIDDRQPRRPGPGGRTAVRGEFGHLRTRISNRTFAAKLALWAALTAGGAALALHPAPWSRVAGVVLLGCMFAHAAELQHQTLHSLGFRNRRANRTAGIVLGVPMLISFAAYRATHLRHHRDLGTPQNREFFDYGNQYGADGARSRWRVGLDWVVRFTMLHFYPQFLVGAARAVARRDYPGESAHTSRGIRRDYHVILGALLALTVLSVVLREPVVLWLWLLPLLLVAGPVHALIELPEHFRCETLSRDAFANTRTIRSNRLMTWFTNGNNFHVEHHLMPNLPIERLPALHAEVRPRLKHFHSGYLDFFRKLVRG